MDSGRRSPLLWRVGQDALFTLGALPYALLTGQRTWRDHGGELSALARVSAGARVLDLGCGPGESAFGMAERVPGIEVTGLDFSAAMIAIARARRRRDRAGERVRFVRGDAMALELADGSIDAVTGHSFLYLVPDARRVLSEAKRVLKPGARAVFLEPAGGPFPVSMRRRALREPRFVASMALWRMVSSRYGRFDEQRARALVASSGLAFVEARSTLDGLGLFVVAERPAIQSLADVDWARFTPKDRATLLFVRDGARVLLIHKKRGLGAGKINAPGGRIDAGETPLAAAVREVEEAVCVTPTGVREAGHLAFQFADGYALTAHVFTATGYRGTPRETDEAVPLWAPVDAIPFERMWADDALWIPLLLAGRRFDGRFVFDGERMLDHALDA